MTAPEGALSTARGRLCIAPGAVVLLDNGNEGVVVEASGSIKVLAQGAMHELELDEVWMTPKPDPLTFAMSDLRTDVINGMHALNGRLDRRADHPSVPFFVGALLGSSSVVFVLFFLGHLH